jgi:DNA-binding NarL/FixJ family response regulator
VQERNRMVREGLVLRLGAVPDLEVVATARDADELLQAVPRFRPAFVVFEVDAPGWEAAEVARSVRAASPETLVIGMANDPLAAACRAAADQLVALIARDDGIDAVVEAARGRPLTVETGGLTAREHQVLSLVANGLPVPEIARSLKISPKTVENHKQSIFAKLGVQTQAHAVSVAVRRGILAKAFRRRDRPI